MSNSTLVSPSSRGGIATSSSLDDAGRLAGRALLALIFILSGFGKATSYGPSVAYMESAGLPGILMPLVILAELGGGILLLVGYQTRIVAVLLAGFTILAGVFFHRDFADMNQTINFLKNLAIAGGFLVLAASGAGRWSIDRARG